MALHIISSHPRKNATYYPLLTMPIINIALSIPSYLSYENGYDRYLFRKSMYKKFKHDCFWRNNKSEIVGVYLLGFKKNLNFILDLCLNGWCVKHGLIKKNKLEERIKSIANYFPYQCATTSDIDMNICNLFVIEYFIYLWNNK